MSQPDAKPRRPAFEELEAALQARQGEHPDRVRLEVTGTSLQGRPVCAATLTNREADDAEKEHVLLTALHSGAARSAAASLFLLMDWLLGQDAVARYLPRRQGVVRTPVVNPDGNVAGLDGNGSGRDPYAGWTQGNRRYREARP